MLVYSVDMSLCLFGVMVRARTKVMTCPPTCGLRLIPLPACTDPLQHGCTPVYHATRHGASATAELLLEHKADVNAQDMVRHGGGAISCTVDGMLAIGEVPGCG